MPCPNQKLFESDEFLVLICDDHIFYAERDEVCFDFKKVSRLKIYRSKDSGWLAHIVGGSSERTRPRASKLASVPNRSQRPVQSSQGSKALALIDRVATCRIGHHRFRVCPGLLYSVPRIVTNL